MERQTLIRRVNTKTKKCHSLKLIKRVNTKLNKIIQQSNENKLPLNVNSFNSGIPLQR